MSDAKDRNGCKAWCGHRWDAGDGGAALRARGYTPMQTGVYQLVGSIYDHETRARRWCSAACCDVRLPPIAAPEPARSQHPERRAGQTWRAQYKEFGNEYILVKHEPRRRGWEAKQPNGSYAFVHDCLWEADFTITLIADAPDSEATVPPAHAPAFDARFANLPLPAGKAEAAKVHDCEQPGSTHHVNVAVRVVKSPLTRDVRTVVLCDMCYSQHESRTASAMREQHRGDWGGVLHEGAPQLIDRRRSYQPMDDSFAEDC